MFGLFDWVWNLLYGISKSMYSIIDNLLKVANMLCGIEMIRYNGNEMDFVSFLMRNPNITYAFVGAVFVGIVLVTIFAIFAILRTIASEKVDKTPAQIFVQVGKTLLIFIFIPAAMTLLIFFTGQIMRVLYSTTLGGSQDGLGRFLAGAFGQNALRSGVDSNFYLLEEFNYHSTSNVKNYLDLSDYDFFFSWLGSIIIILCLGQALLMFVDRAISIVILFIFSPISLSTTVIDDGARFKLWRDQFITKFLMGYGVIIAINIYALIIGAITDKGLVFFDNKLLNNFMKIVIIVGGGVSMNRAMALVGNLISAGAGSNELRDNAIATSGFRRAMVGGALGAFRATRGAVNFLRDTKNTGFGTTLGRSMGFKTNRDYKMEEARLGGAGSGSGNNRKPSQQSTGSSSGVKNALNGGAQVGGGAGKGAVNVINKGSEVVGGQGGQGNMNAQPPNNGSNMVNNAVGNALYGEKKKKGDEK